jgi:RimJ/RimL family protein N-acetyltransferase
MKLNLQPTLESDLLLLRPLKENEFELLFEVASDPLIWEQHPEPDRFKPEVFKKYFDSAIASKGAFIVIDKTNGKVIGCSRYYQYNEADKSVAIGYTFLSRKYWGGNYNRSMKKLMMDHAFQSICTIYFHIGENNYRSQEAIKKTGAKRTEMKNGDGMIYKVEAEDYLL